MNCPVCARSLAPTLSICTGCGAMMNDTVREDLQAKVSARLTPPVKSNTAPALKHKLVSKPLVAPPVLQPKKRVTANLVSHKTSPTLVEFQNKNSSLPDWRIQLQNAVQQRKGGRSDATESNRGPEVAGNDDSALKAAPAMQTAVEPAQSNFDPRVESAMRRIAESEKTFHEMPVRLQKLLTPSRPFGLVAGGAAIGAAVAPARIVSLPKPVLVRIPAPVKRNTNKLPVIESAADANTVAEKPATEKVDESDTAKSVSGSIVLPEANRIYIHSELLEADEPETGAFEDEIEDLAPMSMRFGAGLFDFIIGGFGAMILLSPFAFTSTNWFTAASLVTFGSAFAIVTFIYMTACLGLWGKTMGMRLFQLELVDAVDNEYPTLRQASISSSVFLIATAAAGAGFLTIFRNEEKRALHDLLSGTIIVREF